MKADVVWASLRTDSKNNAGPTKTKQENNGKRFASIPAASRKKTEPGEVGTEFQSKQDIRQTI